MISKRYILDRLRQWCNTPEGRARIKQHFAGGFKNSVAARRGISVSEMDKYLMEIILKLHAAISAVIGSFAHSQDSIHASAPVYDSAKQAFLSTISIDSDALRRESLHYMDKREYSRSSNLRISAGRGVYDIVGLFTHGYEIHGRRPYGFWVHEGGNSEDYIGAKMQRDPNPFLQQLVDRLNTEYDNICEVRLDDKYI